jgi:drug/metabolite transporter (DMT)-like permease
MDKHSFSKGVIYMLISSVGLSLTGLLGKISTEDISLTGLVFFRFLSAFIFCLMLYGFLGKLKWRHRDWHIKSNLLRAFFVLGAQYSFYYYIQKDTLLNGMALLNTGPLFIPLIEKIFLGNRIGKSTWISIVVSFVGVMLILQPSAGIFSVVSLVGFCSGIFQAGSQVIFGLNSKGENVEFSVMVLFALCAIASFPFYLTLDNVWQQPAVSTTVIVLLFAGLGIASIINQLARAEAYKYSTPARLASFLYFSVVLAGLYDWIVFHSPPNLLSCAGALLVILGRILKIVLRRRFIRQKEKQFPPV